MQGEQREEEERGEILKCREENKEQIEGVQAGASNREGKGEED